MLMQLYYADFTQIIYAIHYAFYAFYAFITQIIYADFTQIIYAIHYAVYAIQLRKYIYAITIISLRRLRKYRFSLRRFTQRALATCWCNQYQISITGNYELEQLSNNYQIIIANFYQIITTWNLSQILPWHDSLDANAGYGSSFK